MSTANLPWLFRNMRLKILALVLALGLLLAVAFSENPLTIHQVSAPIRYADPPAGLVVISPPSRVTFTVSGLSSAVRTISDSNTFATIDLSKVKAGPSQTVLAQPSVLVNGVGVQGGAVPLAFSVQELQLKTLDIHVNTKPAPGYEVIQEKTYAYCDNPSQPCQIQVSAPASILGDLVAEVNVEGEISNTSITVPNLPVKFSRQGRPFDLQGLSTFPKPSIAPAEVKGVQVLANKSVSAKPVTLRPRVLNSGRQSCGLVINGISINPGGGVAVVSGPLDLVGKSPDIIDLPTIDLTGAGANVQKIFTVPLTDAKLQVDPGTVTVTVLLQKQFDCTAPTPQPTPVPTPTPSPSASPR